MDSHRAEAAGRVPVHFVYYTARPGLCTESPAKGDGKSQPCRKIPARLAQTGKMN